MTTRRYMSLIGTQLNINDYVMIHDVWVKLIEEVVIPEKAMRRQARRFIGVDKTSTERVVLIYTSKMFKAYKNS